MAGRENISRVLALDASSESPEIERVLKALDSLNRIRILRYLADRVASVNDIATALELPTSTTALHVEMLEEAGLIRTELEPASRGLRKVCARMYDKIILDLPIGEQPREQAIELSMPIGAFTDCQVSPTCGLLSEAGIIGLLDDPASFYEPDRRDAQLIWFYQGYVEYRFPNRLPAGARPESLRLSMEICSEAPLHNPNWPSDITIWINGTEIATWTSPADFGGERGRLTPEWWTPRNTQYGLLKVWHVNEEATEVAEITRWLDQIPQPYGLDEAHAYLAACTRGWEAGAGASFAVLEPAGGQLLGSVGLRLGDLEPGVAEAGYWVAREARGRGVATHALRLASQWLFREAGVERIQLRADVLNVLSQRVAEKAGFRREGILRSLHYNARVGRRVDFVVFSLLPDDLP